MRNIQRLPRRRHDGNDVEGRLGTVDMVSQEKRDEQKELMQMDTRSTLILRFCMMMDRQAPEISHVRSAKLKATVYLER